MRTLSLKLDDTVFGDTENILTRINISRNRYINEALSYYNKIQHRLLLEKRLESESSLVRDESLSVLNDFEAIGYDS